MLLMIVDDDDLERQGLRAMISKLNLDVEVCASAWNGHDALETAMKLELDIVITDVRMPIMDGITFARQIRVHKPACFIIFMSGFEDFQAAREALAIGANAWLVKPVNREELRAILGGICDMAKEVSRKKQEDKLKDKRLEVLLLLSRQDFIKSLLQNREAQDDNSIAERADELEIQLFPGSFAVMVVEIQNGIKKLENNMEAILLAGKGVRFPEVLAIVEMPGMHLALVLAFPEIAGETVILNRLEIIAEHLLLQATTSFQTCASVGVSLTENSLKEIGKLYKQAYEALEESLYYNRGNVMFYSDNPHQALSDYSAHIIREVRNIVKNEIGGDLSAEALATHVYLTSSHLRRVFKNRTGITLQNYVTKMRMECARELLREPGNRVHIVASMVGYESTSYFCLVFKKFFGINPGEFRINMNYMD